MYLQPAMIILGCLLTGFFFGVWQGSFSAGVFMALLLATLNESWN